MFNHFLRTLLEDDASHQPTTKNSVVSPPSRWSVNWAYHVRHHEHNERAYFSGEEKILDIILATAISFKNKRVAILGSLEGFASPLRQALQEAGALMLDGHPLELGNHLNQIDVLIVSTLSPNDDLMMLHQQAMAFLGTITSLRDIVIKELLWVVPDTETPVLTSGTQVKYQVLDHLIRISRLDAPCIVRKVVMPSSQTKLNPQAVSRYIVQAIRRDVRNIVPGQPVKGLLCGLYENAMNVYLRVQRPVLTQQLDVPSLTATLS